jgi:hypothetical protein
MESYLKNLTPKEKHTIILGDKYVKFIAKSNYNSAIVTTLLILKAKTNPSQIIEEYDNLNTLTKIYLTYTPDLKSI